MKRFLLACILCLMIAGVCSANQFGVEIKKDVNGGYLWGMPIVIDMKAHLPFIPKVYIKETPLFTAPRSDFKALNHLRNDLVIGGGITLFGGNLEFETGWTHWWAGNSQGAPEMDEWNNSARFYWEW